jgi:hypothetical protein
MKIWSFNNGLIEVSVHKWNVKYTGAQFYTVNQTFSNDFDLKNETKTYEFQTFNEANELASQLVNTKSLMN